MNNGCSNVRPYIPECKEIPNPYYAIEMDENDYVYLITRIGDRINIGKGIIKDKRIVLMDRNIKEISIITK